MVNIFGVKLDSKKQDWFGTVHTEFENGNRCYDFITSSCYLSFSNKYEVCPLVLYPVHYLVLILSSTDVNVWYDVIKEASAASPAPIDGTTVWDSPSAVMGHLVSRSGVESLQH